MITFGWWLALLTAGASLCSGEQSPAGQDVIVNSIGMKLTRIPAGEFQMGSADSDPGARDDEQPQHRVRITKSFYIGVFEVTQAEYEAVMGNNPSSFSKVDAASPQRPVDDVTWYEAVEFCRRLTAQAAENRAGRIYRLPTEAEWEYACRAGTTTTFHYGNSLSSRQANFNGAYPFGDSAHGPFLNHTTPVGSYAPNSFGLHDMHGNLHEWCLDRFDRDYYRVSPMVDPPGPEKGTSRVIRGGDWYSDGRDCRSAFRYADLPEGRFYALGMRVVCELASEGARIHPVIAGSFANRNQLRRQSVKTGSGVAAPQSEQGWPNWRGPTADAHWPAPKLPNTWPDEGLHRVWTRNVGGGYGGIAVFDRRVVVMDRQRQPRDVERVLCHDAVDGRQLWVHSYEVKYDNVSYDNGPRTTPTILDGHVFTLGAVGHLRCLELKSGDVVWANDLVRDFGARIPIWGLSASPVIVDDLLIVHAGAVPNGCFIAFDRATGAERWRSLPDPTGYATPIVVGAGSGRQLIGWTPSHVRCLDPLTGALLWTVPFEVNNGTAIANPLFQEGIVLVSSYYDGSKAIRVERENAEVAWHDKRNLRALMCSPLYRNRHAYLIDKRHGLTCFEFATGRKVWDDDNRMTPKGRNPHATMVWVNDEDRAIVLNSDGDLVLIRLNPSGYIEEARANIIGRTWAHPAFSGNCIFARSDTELICVALPVAE
jgi:outer membrane protein assembly factor BamB